MLFEDKKIVSGAVDSKKTRLFWRMKLKTRSCVLVAVLTSLVLMHLVYFIGYANNPPFYRDRNMTQLEVERNLAEWRLKERRRQQSGAGAGDGVSCKHPDLDVFDEAVMKFFPPSPPLQCPGKGKDPWVHVRGGVLVVDQNLVRERGIRCKFSEIIRASDDMNKRGPTYSTDKDHKLRASDFAEADCVDKFGQTWKSVLAGGWRNPRVEPVTGWNFLNQDSLPVNVLIWGFDSISRNTFIRKLPKSYDFLVNQLSGGVVLKGYNIVGDGTPQALIPILTGKTEIELPDTRKRMGDAAAFVDVYPFIWKRFRSHGYVTNFLEDGADIGTFQYRLKGFNEQPTDIYSRPFYVARQRLGLNRQCHHGKSVNLMVQEYFKAAWEAYADKPKWFFGFQSEYSHDDHNRIGIVDDELLDFLHWLRDGGHLNRTVLVVMSDHGHRFAAIRKTHQGKLEERMPFFYFHLPPWLEAQHPEAVKNFRRNAELLSTPFDVHETMEDLLRFKSVDFNADVREPVPVVDHPVKAGVPADGPAATRAPVIPRGISLFRRIPRERTCSDAGIEAHWCACLQWEPLDGGSERARDVAAAVLDVVNKYNEGQLRQFRDAGMAGVDLEMCARWRLGSVVWAAKFASNENILKFSQSQDADGFHPQLDAATAAAVEIYQISFVAEPGSAQFEATAHYDVQKDFYRVEIGQVSRINKYKSQAGCVADKLHQLRKFCNCLKY